MENVFYYKYDFGKIGITESEELITGVFLGDVSPIGDFILNETDVIKEAALQLSQYFAHERKVFDLPMNLSGTPYQIKVWNALTKIPYGTTITYKQLATNIGNPNAARAVGNCNNKNRHMIIVPCHRVIGAKGDLVGYAGGLHVKQMLLELEQV